MSGLNNLILAIFATCGSVMLIGVIVSVAARRLPTALLWCLGAIPLACTLIIPARNVSLRGLVAFVAAECAFKLIDYWSRPRELSRTAAWREFISLLIPFPSLAIVYPDHRRKLLHPDRILPHVARIFFGIVVFVTALLLIKRLEQSPALNHSAVLTHISRVIIFIPAIEALSQVLYALERLGGYDTRPIIHKAYLARTVGDFWRRYNYRVHDWLYRHVFVPCGGRKRPARAVLLVFLFSGLFHEVMFAAATSQWTGYQFAFFAIQGPAVLASSYLDKSTVCLGATGTMISHAFTIVFLSASSVLFFDGVSKVFPMILVSGSALP